MDMLIRALLVLGGIVAEWFIAEDSVNFVGEGRINVVEPMLSKLHSLDDRYWLPPDPFNTTTRLPT